MKVIYSHFIWICYKGDGEEMEGALKIFHSPPFSFILRVKHMSRMEE